MVATNRISLQRTNPQLSLVATPQINQKPRYELTKTQRDILVKLGFITRRKLNRALQIQQHLHQESRLRPLLEDVIKEYNLAINPKQTATDFISDLRNRFKEVGEKIIPLGQHLVQAGYLDAKDLLEALRIQESLKSRPESQRSKIHRVPFIGEIIDRNELGKGQTTVRQYLKSLAGKHWVIGN